jgi:hypothetical protein
MWYLNLKANHPEIYHASRKESFFEEAMNLPDLWEESLDRNAEKYLNIIKESKPDINGYPI